MPTPAPFGPKRSAINPNCPAPPLTVAQLLKAQGHRLEVQAELPDLRGTWLSALPRSLMAESYAPAHEANKRRICKA